MCDKAAKHRLRDEILECYLRDNVKARLQQPDGSYARPAHKASRKCAQDWLIELARDPNKQLGRATDTNPSPSLNEPEEAPVELTEEQSGL